MKVLIVGSGAREHALAWRINQSPRLTRLWVAGGNAGTGRIASNVDVNPEAVEAVVSTARSLSIDLVVVGPEIPLALGLVDRLSQHGIPAFGPTKAAAQIESSKAFALEVMRDAGVPCPEFHVFNDEASAISFLEKRRQPWVVKADGLAAGKGVSLCNSPEEAAAAVRDCMTGELFGSAGKTVVIEEMLTGPEVSVFAFTDGDSVSTQVAACDHKRLNDGDQGPNTGGMGAFTPPDFWSEDLSQQIEQTIMVPVIRTMAQRGTPYRGILYAGVMLTLDGPKVLEFNCRLGDPEAQVILPTLVTDPLDVFMACCQGNLASAPVRWSNQCHAGVVMASGGYPGSYDTGFEVSGLDPESPDTLVFHAGTRLDASHGEERVVTSGGRVVTVVGRGDSLAQARVRAYDRLGRIRFQGAYYRRDIGDLVAGERAWAPGRPTPAG